MCGICGVFSNSDNNTVNQGIVKEMTDSMAHRGPDDEGIYLGLKTFEDRFRLGLGHRRLSIIDLSTQGHQPMCNENGTIWIVYNGEIYNFQSLKNDLLRRGHIFKSHTDTEVLIHLYEEEGKNCVKKLRGMFSFAIWDERNRSIFLARDRLGIKPMYYCIDSEALVFASEIKAILKSKMVGPQVNRDVLDIYLTLGYVPAPQTMFRNIYKLLPGHTLTYNHNGASIEKYWDIDSISENSIVDENTYIDTFMGLLDESVKMRLISDVPLGVFLSGGIDSSTVVALMSKMASGRVKTFSVGYKDKQASELAYARIIAKKFNTEHHEFCLEPTDFYEFIPKLVWHFDEPVSEVAAIPLYFISKLSREHVTVLLSGEGADELLAGYSIYKYMQAIEMYRKLPFVVRKNITGPFLAKLMNAGNKKRKYLQWLNLPLEQRYLGVSSELENKLKDSLYSDDFRNSSGNKKAFQYLSPYYERVQNKDTLAKMLYTDTKVWLPDDLLIKADKMSMATSVELRVPFLDHKLVEFATSMPSKLKLRNGTGKYLLKKSVSKLLPKEIIHRKKRGFPVPIKAWFKGDFNEKATEMLLDTRTAKRGYFNTKQIEPLLKLHKEGKEDFSKLLFSLIVLESWHRVFIDT